MVTAFVLINVREKRPRKIAEAVNSLDGVKEVHIVAGEYDMVAVVRVEDNETLSRLLTEKLIHTSGIQHTKTLISLQSQSAGSA